MKYIAILLGIIVFWFLLGITLSSIYADELLISDLETKYNSTYESLNSTNFNSTNLGDEGSTGKNFIDSIGVRMLTFRIPATGGISSGFVAFINLLNFILLLLAIVCIYKLANPLSSA